MYRLASNVVPQGERLPQDLPISIQKGDNHLVDGAMVRTCHVELLHLDGWLEGVKGPPGGGKRAQLDDLLLAARVVGCEETQVAPLLPIIHAVQAPTAAP